jgi:DNA-binding SARP family transcriptional activator/tetratricopeptide (TPR) repeat protein
MSVQFRLLGPVEIDNAGHLLRLTRRRERCLLAVLLLDPNQVVSVDRLAHLLWDGAPPEQARRIIHSHISRLRSVLSTGDGAVIESIGDGYRISVDPSRVDVHRFRGLLAQASAAVEPANRVAQLRAALELWQGRPLDDIGSDWLRDRLCTRLSEQHMAATEDLMTASLALRRERQVLPELAQLARAHPGREALVGLHMRALYQASRKADALEVYDRARTYLADEYGLDPSPALRELHQAILRDELTVPAVPAAAIAGSTSAIEEVPVPRQLPADVSSFTGRSAQLDQLDTLLDRDDAGKTVVISAIGGTAGVGKTALAVHWAHRVADRFPDGQLFLDLHGFTEGVCPVEPSDALDRLLRALGVPGERIPPEVEDRAGLWRGILAGRRMLILLDNAAGEAQVAPLLPGMPGCPVVVTSRRRLAGLDAADPMPLDVLPLADAVALFTRTGGEQCLASDAADLVAETVQLCGRLPLAIRIAAARLRSHPTWRVSHLVERLRDQQQRLGELKAGQRSVTGALELSYRHLGADEQVAYRLLGLHPGPEFDAYATTALLDSTLLHAGRVLDLLLAAHLLNEPAPGRYRFHDLTRAHAAHTASRDHAAPSSDAALERLLDNYRHTASAAMDTAYPYEREHRPRVPPAHTPRPALPDPAVALAWLDTELPNLLAAAGYATEHGRPAHLLHLSTILHRHLRTRGRYHDAETLHRQALIAACAVGDQTGQLNALTGLGYIHWRQGRYEQATDRFEQALRIARTTGRRSGELTALTGLGDIHRRQGRHRQAIDHYGQALQVARATGHRSGELDALRGLGDIHLMQGRYGQAADHYERALRIARATGHRSGELTALTGLGDIHRRQGRYGQAADHFERALRIARTTGDRPAELNALIGLGHLSRLQGRYGQAADHYRRALQVARATGNRPGELNALTGLGDIHLMQGQYAQASDHFRRLLDLAHESGDRNFEFEAWQGLGRLSHATGDPDAAVDYHERALAIAGELGQPVDQARARDGLAHAHHARAQHEQARGHWQHALNLLTGLGIDNTADEGTTTAAIRAHLTALAER